MSMYGPPGGPYPGQPQDPWQGGQADDPYGETPVDPYGRTWSQPDAHGHGGAHSQGPDQGGYGQRTYDQRGYGQQGHDPQGRPLGYRQGSGYGATPYSAPPSQGWGQPQEVWGPPAAAPPRRRASGVLITLVVVLAILLCGGAGIAIYTATRDKPTANPAVTGGATQSAVPTGGSTVAPNDAVTAKIGDCLANEGSPQAPRLRKVTCAAGTFEVLTRIEGTSDIGRCSAVPGYTHNYFYKTATEKTSFVLCMRQR